MRIFLYLLYYSSIIQIFLKHRIYIINFPSQTLNCRVLSDSILAWNIFFSIVLHSSDYPFSDDNFPYILRSQHCSFSFANDSTYVWLIQGTNKRGFISFILFFPSIISSLLRLRPVIRQELFLKSATEWILFQAKFLHFYWDEGAEEQEFLPCKFLQSIIFCCLTTIVIWGMENEFPECILS